MEEKFLKILGNIWVTDIAYQESQEQIRLIMKAMTKAYELGNKTNDIHNVSGLLIAWEQFKKENWWESEAINVEKALIDKFSAIYGR